MTGPTDPTEINPPTWSAPPVVPPVVPTAPPSSGASATDAPVPAYDPVSPVTAARRPTRKRGAIDVLLIVAAIFAIGGIGFAVGRVTSPASTAAAAGGRFQAGQGNGQGGQFPASGQGGLFGAGGITISGEVVAVTADQLSLKLASGQTIQIPLNGTTTYHSQAPATAADVTTGATVQVQVQVGRGTGGGPNASPGTGGAGGGTGNGGRFQFGAATSVTVVPK
jgi:hypothetical protein